MKNHKHLILGFTGGIGRAAALALDKRNVPVKVMIRDANKADKYTVGIRNVEIVSGDASNPKDLNEAFKGVGVVHYCINVPYHLWEKQALQLLKNCVDAAVAHEVKLVFPGNVYVYGHAKYNPVNEKHPHAAHTKKGHIRMEMEEMLALANTEKGLDYTIIRMPDFYGPYVINSFSEQLYTKAIKGKSIQWIGDLDAEIELIFIEDGGEAMAMAALNGETKGEVYNIPGVEVITARKYLTEIINQAGTKSKIGTLNSDVLFKTIGLFNPLVREIVEMLYLKREKLILDGTKFENIIGPLPGTAYSAGISRTLEWAKTYYGL